MNLKIKRRLIIVTVLVVLVVVGAFVLNGVFSGNATMGNVIAKIGNAVQKNANGQNLDTPIIPSDGGVS